MNKSEWRASIARPSVFVRALEPGTNRVLVLLFFIAALVLQLPGHVPYDGIVVWHEAETGKLYAQHPAALVLVWRLCESVIKGPALFTALQLFTLWLAAYLLAARTRPPFWLALLLYISLLLAPPFLANTGVTVKDVFGAHLALLGFALALSARGRTTWGAAFAAATLAMLFRYQLGLMLPLLALMLWRQRLDRAGKMIVAIVGVALTYGLVAVAVAMLFVKTGPGDIQLSLRKMAIFDIAGVVAHHPETPLPVIAQTGVNTTQLKQAMRRDYSPMRVDTLWQGQNGGGTITAQSGVFGMLWAVPNREIFSQWKALALHEPQPLLAHRIAAFARVLGFGSLYDCRPITAGISWLPKPAAAAVSAKQYPAPLSTALLTSHIFPAGLFLRAFLYVVLLGLVLALRPPPSAVLLAGFGLAYEASFFFLPQACEVRYSYPTMLAAVIATWLFLAEFVGRRNSGAKITAVAAEPERPEI